MYKQTAYFKLGRAEEIEGNFPSALLLYLSSFCQQVNNSIVPYRETAKIRKLQLSLGIQDQELLSMLRSYGSLSDFACRKLLYASIGGNLSVIKDTLSHQANERRMK